MTDPAARRASVWTIVVAAGSGERFGGTTPKQFVEVAGRRVLDHSVAAAATVSEGVVVVLPAGRLGDAPDACAAVAGGASRSASVRAGLASVPEAADVVLVHDAARPVASPALFSRVVDAVVAGADAVTPVVPVVDTLRTLAGDPRDRSQFQAVQTPQGFRARALRSVHADEPEATDDAGLIAAAGGAVATVAGERWNIKLTEPEDRLVVGALLEARTTP